MNQTRASHLFGLGDDVAEAFEVMSVYRAEIGKAQLFKKCSGIDHLFQCGFGAPRQIAQRFSYHRHTKQQLLGVDVYKRQAMKCPTWSESAVGSKPI